MLLALTLTGCSDELGKAPYIPASNYSCSVTIAVPTEAKVGEWIPLGASRTSGPWQQIPRSKVTDESVAFPKCPPAFETNVQANLFWLAEPTNALRLDIPTLDAVQTNPFGRKALFTQAGVYRIRAVTTYPTRATSDVETITVRAR